ncbi:MAG TPA: hypothetical protein HA224_04690 [Nanoarchaeota archaeon]|nr:hypothetical protein [Nanoarchaeota archaeon]
MAELEIIGFLAGFIVAFALSPQLIKTWRTKSAKDISLLWTLTLMIGLLLWVIYAIANKIIPLAIFGVVEFSMATTLCAFKLIYK